MVLCWAAFTAALGRRWPPGHGLDAPGGTQDGWDSRGQAGPSLCVLSSHGGHCTLQSSRARDIALRHRRRDRPSPGRRPPLSWSPAHCWHSSERDSPPGSSAARPSCNHRCRPGVSGPAPGAGSLQHSPALSASTPGASCWGRWLGGAWACPGAVNPVRWLWGLREVQASVSHHLYRAQGHLA